MHFCKVGVKPFINQPCAVLINTILIITIQITTIDRYIYPWYTLYKIFIRCIFTFPALVSYVPVAVLGANLNTVMRVHVPLEMQGRVFSARDTLQNITIPLGLFLGGIWADHVFEPFMSRPSAIQHALALFFGVGKGSGIAIMFFIVGIIGFILSIAALRNPLYQSLNDSK